MARKHNLDEVLRTLARKNDIRVNSETKTIRILSDYVWNRKTGKDIINPKKKFDLGNGSWGKIDFLINYCDFGLYHVNEF